MLIHERKSMAFSLLAAVLEYIHVAVRKLLNTKVKKQIYLNCQNSLYGQMSSE